MQLPIGKDSTLRWEGVALQGRGHRDLAYLGVHADVAAYEEVAYEEAACEEVA